MAFKQSFYDWCIENNRTDMLDRWDYQLNSTDPHNISIQSKEYFYLKCPHGIHKSSKFQIATLPKHNSPLECKYCLSFEYWCVKNNRQDLLDRWDYDLNKIAPEDVTKSSPKAYYFKCPRGIHESSSYKLMNLTKYSYGAAQCKWCNSFAQWGIDNICEDFLEKYWDYDKNQKYDPWKIPYGARKTTVIYIKCQRDSFHDSYKTYPDHFTQGCRCPQCAREKTESYLQESVKAYLESTYNYNLTHEYECSIIPYNYKSKHYMPFDNDLKIDDNIHLIIEVHGEQHYKISHYTKLYAKRANIAPEEALKYQQERDEYKKQYALSKGYHYLAIPYWTEQDESYKTLIDNKIQEILNNTKLTISA